jgi:serine phosphatase RsbU (regulator of sigma subunit)/anti-sigma regulatory factor (Ser/Thr protein kinase)
MRHLPTRATRVAGPVRHGWVPVASASIESWIQTTGDLADVGRARQFLQAHLVRAGIEGDRLDDAVLCVSEAVTNAIVHAGGVTDLRVGFEGVAVRVEVEDRKPGRVAVAAPEPTDTSGRGLLIIDTVASRWGAMPTTSGGKVVWFEIDLGVDPGRDSGDVPDADGLVGIGAAATGTGPLPTGPTGEAPGTGDGPGPWEELAGWRRWLAVLAAVLGIGASLAAARWTSELAQPEITLAVCGGALVVVVTLLGGLRAGVLASMSLAAGALVFHRDVPLAQELSAPVLAIGTGLGAVVVAAFTWSWGELRARSRARATLFDRLGRLSAGLSGVETAGDPVAEVERQVADAAGAASARVLPVVPAERGAVPADSVVLPLDGPRRHRSLELRGLRGVRAGGPASAGAGERMAFLRSVADRCAEVLERIELHESERRARADVELLADASRVLSESLDVDRVIAALRSVVVPRVADRCAVLLDAPVRPGTEPPGSDVSSAVQSTAAAALELRSRGRRLGRMVATRTQPPFDDEDLALLAELAARAAVALDNAQLYEDQAASTGVLEGSLLPHALLPVRDLDVGARYLPATSGHLVGGDFYDAIRLPGDGIVLLIGDVQGKGVEAATLTAVARHTLRSAALAGEGPAVLLDRVNEALRYHQAERDALGDDVMVRFITAAVAKLTPTSTGFHATVACGGHPYPIVVRPGGEVEHVQATGSLLGVFDEAGCTEVELDLELSDIFVLYTDGVVEHREAVDLFDELQLGRLLRNQLTLTGADDLAQLVLDTVVEVSATESRDDIAILVARVTGPR